MTSLIEDLQTHVQFQLSLLNLVNTQHGSESVSALPAVEIAEQQNLHDALGKIVSSIH